MSKIVIPPLVKDRTNEERGHLKILRFAGMDVRPNGLRNAKWLCKCRACGRELIITSMVMTRRSHCGCIGKEKSRAKCRTHGQAKTRPYKLWRYMIDRCHNPKTSTYKYYGARGISVCQRWRGPGGYINFVADMGKRPEGGNLSLDRIDNDGDYEPSNCRWATRTQQMRNSRNARILEFRGERHCYAEWEEITGIRWPVIRGRIRNGWTPEEALTLPVGQSAWLHRASIKSSVPQ